ncbi:hypothetical protein [Alloalcanivorax marinus]|uniref:hypothetical protein n=1 Tax=Alloalcanivorax marinus TaxID=1177169 RepID=UPI00195E5557|nr:hypothetical protein [Alloalcanivorax marinus]MBM7335614.1 hypothetical protein [Alloalcanivorax marinus]
MSKSMKKALMAVVAGAALTGAVSAQAQVGEIYEAGNSGNPLTTADGTFSGTTTLAYGGGPNITCTLTLDGTVEVDSGGATGRITVTDGDISGGFLCGLVSISGFPWVSNDVAASDLAPISSVAQDVDIVFEDQIDVNLCGNDLDFTAVFNNNGTTVNSAPSTFEVSNTLGSCSLVGTLTVQGDDIDAVQN